MRNASKFNTDVVIECKHFLIAFMFISVKIELVKVVNIGNVQIKVSM